MEVHQAGKHSAHLWPQFPAEHPQGGCTGIDRDPLGRIGQRQGGSDRSAPRDSAQQPGVAGMKMEGLGEFPVGPITRTLPCFHSRDMGLIPGL